MTTKSAHATRSVRGKPASAKAAPRATSWIASLDSRQKKLLVVAGVLFAATAIALYTQFRPERTGIAAGAPAAADSQKSTSAPLAGGQVLPSDSGSDTVQPAGPGPTGGDAQAGAPGGSPGDPQPGQPPPEPPGSGGPKRPKPIPGYAG
jgi:hypothetical protein